MNRVPLRLTAALTALLLLGQTACASARPPRVSPAEMDDVIPCRGYQNSLDEQPPSGQSGALVGALASAATILAGIVVAQPACGEYACGLREPVLGLALVGAGIGGLTASIVAGARSHDRRPAQAQRCEAELARVCAGVEDDVSCRAALEQACTARDDGACWAIHALPALRSAPTPSSAPEGR